MEYELLKKDLKQRGFAHLSKIFESEEIVETQQLLDLLFQKESKLNTIAERAKLIKNQYCNVFEINHTIKIKPSLKQTAVFRKCQKLASEILGKNAKVAFDHAIYKQPSSGQVKWHQDQAYKSSVKKCRVSTFGFHYRTHR